MRWLSVISSRVGGMFGSACADRELQAELDAHLECQVDEYVRAGHSSAEARRLALVKLGSATAVTQQYRERRGWPLAESLLQDLRQALRGMRRHPTFALACIATLALGTGVNSAMFGVVNGVLFAPLPYSQPDQLVSIWTRHPEVQPELGAVSAANAVDLRGALKTVKGLEVLQANILPSTVRVNGEAVAARGAQMSAGMFALLGREPLLGRGFHEGDSTNVVVLSHGFWMRQFGGAPSVIGRQLGDGGRAVTVIGVMPRDFAFPYPSMLRATVSFTASADVDFWVPMPPAALSPARTPPSADGTRAVRLFAVVARLRDGVTLSEAQADLDVAWRQLARAYPQNAGWEARAVPLHDQAVAPVRSALLLLLGGVGVVLLIACVNVANLLLARGVARERELAMRTALGAPRGRLVQQMLTESLVLSGFGAAGGLVFARWAMPVVVALAPPNTPRLQEIGADWRLVAFAAVAAIVCGLAIGVLPAFSAARGSIRGAIDEGSRGGSDGRRRLRSLLAAAEVALAVVLTIGAGLLVRSFVTVLQIDPGFQSDRVLTMSASVPSRYETPAARVEFYQQLFARLEALPGVEAVGGNTRLPLAGANSTTEVAVEGQLPPEGQWPLADLRRALHDYFPAMGIALKQGRLFDARDAAGAPPVVLVNETLSRRLFGDADPVGRQLRLGPSSPIRQATIIGIVGDLRHQGLDLAPAPEVYVHYLQGPPVAPFLVIRTSVDPVTLIPSVRAAAREVEATFAPYNFRTMDDWRSTSLLDRRFLVGLASAFGLLALLLAAVGVYGVMTLIVAERTREMGIRLALGASPSRLMTMVLRQALNLALAGGAAGLAAALVLAPLLASQLYGVGTADAVTIAVVSAVLLAVALLASWLPARRVLRVDPIATLRAD